MQLIEQHGAHEYVIQRSTIGSDLFDELKIESRGGGGALYSTRQAALEALSAACVDYARSLAWPDLAPLQMTLQNTG